MYQCVWDLRPGLLEGGQGTVALHGGLTDAKDAQGRKHATNNGGPEGQALGGVRVKAERSNQSVHNL